ncbi:MAG: sugar phosphate isomerase/epimerase family protein [Candidatus Hadarchaeum sp.]|uniref:sugar phosphate isomerase/epimerase family protein n=1 Tax=Candidatus Hadarchaeum sp. TaxID=2883567 RepID=UPI003D136873
MVNLGRNFKNCLLIEHLDERERLAFIKGNLDLKSIKPEVFKKATLNVERQIKIITDLGMPHLEIELDATDAYLDFYPEKRKRIKELANSNGITLSVNLPHSFANGGIGSLREEDREAATEIQKKHIQLAADVEAKYVNLRPGNVPAENRTDNYREMVHNALINSLVELGKFSRELGLALHLENNTAFEGICSEIDECLKLVKKLREQDLPIYFNFDIGNWLTNAEFTHQTPPQPESALEPIPPDYIKELHLSDYVPGEMTLRPPLHLEWGLLKHYNLERYARLAKIKRAETVVVETEVKSIEQAINYKEILRKETDYLLPIFG